MLGLLALAVVAAGLVAYQTAQAQQGSAIPGEAIVDRALEDHLTWQGECWPWVREVVRESTGNPMGFGYHSGLIAGGAEQVPLSNARTGDVIQIVNPSDPDNFYPGMHTAIVHTNHGGGVFTVVDSNSQFNGIVRIRENYDPVYMANRAHVHPNLEVRAYRFETFADGSGGGGSSPTEPPSSGGGNSSFEEGDTVETVTGANCLNVRSRASTSAGVVRCVPDGTEMEVLNGSAQANGYTWISVQLSDGTTGWAADAFVEAVDGSGSGAGSGGNEPTATPTPEPTPTPTPEPEPEPTATQKPDEIDREGLVPQGVVPGLTRTD